MSSIARELGCTRGAIRLALQRQGIPSRWTGTAPPRPQKPPQVVFDPAVIAARYAAGETTEQIAGDLGISRQALRGRLARQGIPPSPRTARFPQLDDAHWLRSVYVLEQRTITSIALEVGCSRPTVRMALVEHRLLRNADDADPRAAGASEHHSQTAPDDIRVVRDRTAAR